MTYSILTIMTLKSNVRENRKFMSNFFDTIRKAVLGLENSSITFDREKLEVFRDQVVAGEFSNHVFL